MNSKNIDEVIDEKTRELEEKTGNKVVKEERQQSTPSSYVDWPSWQDMKQLPKIVYMKSVRKVHILHELVHLEKFFVEYYGVIVHTDESLTKIDEVFRNLPENYVAHKVIRYEYGFDPIDKDWFNGKDRVQGLTSEEIAAHLVDFWAFTKFCPEYKPQLSLFSKKCEEQNPIAFDKANRAIQALKEMNYRERDSYNHCAEEIIEIFAPNYHKTKLYLAYPLKTGGVWKWIPLSIS